MKYLLFITWILCETFGELKLRSFISISKFAVFIYSFMQKRFPRNRYTLDITHFTQFIHHFLSYNYANYTQTFRFLLSLKLNFYRKLQAFIVHIFQKALPKRFSKTPSTRLGFTALRQKHGWSDLYIVIHTTNTIVSFSEITYTQTPFIGIGQWPSARHCPHRPFNSVTFRHNITYESSGDSEISINLTDWKPVYEPNAYESKRMNVYYLSRFDCIFRDMSDKPKCHPYTYSYSLIHIWTRYEITCTV